MHLPRLPHMKRAFRILSDFAMIPAGVAFYISSVLIQ
jgi:hypothetical protein